MVTDPKDESEKVLQFEDFKDITIPTDEDTKKKQDKKRRERERRASNESVLRSLKLGKYKNK